MNRSVLFLTTEWPSDDAPVTGIFVREFAIAASRVAHVAVVHVQREPGERGLYDVRAFDDGVPVWRIRYRRFRKPLSLIAFVLGTRAAIRATGRRFDIVHSHSILATVLARLIMRGTPIVYTEQWSIFLPDSPYELRPALRVLARIALRGASLVLPPSRAMRDALTRVVPDLAVRVIPNVVDTELFSANGEKALQDVPQLVSVGMMPPSHVKGIDFLLRAGSLLAQGGRDFVLHLAGDGPMRREYESLASRLDIADRVRFHGVLSKPELSRLLQRCDLFVLASRFDNNPCVVIEAMASGLPVVATRVGGVPEMVEPESGLLVEPQSPEALATGLERALSRLSEFDRGRIAARAGERYGRPHIAAELAAAYDEALTRD